MNIRKALMALSFAVLGVLPVTHAYASSVNVEGLLTGNTAFGKKMKWGLSISVLFRTDGQIIVVDERGNREAGNWWVNGSGELCTKFKRESCRKVSKGGNGNYQIHNESDDKLVDWSLAEIKRGNPYGIE